MTNVESITSASRLSPAVRHSIRQSLTVELSCEVFHRAAERHPPGVTDYSATFVVHVDSDDAAGDVRDGRMTERPSKDGYKLDDGLMQVTVGTASLVLGQLMYGSLFDAFDARSADLAEVATVILDASSGELSESLLAEVEGFGNDVLIVDHVHVQPEWRGLGLGLLGTGLAIEHLARSAAVVALYAMTPGLDNERERRIAARRLGAYWERLSFRHFRDGVYVLDPNLVHLGDRLKELQR